MSDAMPLLAVQHALAASLADADAAPHALPWLAGPDAVVRRRLGIYRANVGAAAAKALGAACPVVRQLVGDDCFDALARAYRQEHPSTSGDLADFGAGFDAFLRGFGPLQALPYLADLARLEWAVHRAEGARDAEPWDAASLAPVAPARQAAIRFAWAAGTAVVDSAVPLARLWAIHQPGYDGDFSVDWSVGGCVLVARAGFRVTVSAVGRGDAAFIAASLDGAALGAAAAAACAADPAFDLAGLLARAVASGLLCGFTIEQDD